MEITITYNEDTLFTIRDSLGGVINCIATMNEAAHYANGLSAGYNAARAKLGKAHVYHSASCIGKA